MRSSGGRWWKGGGRLTALLLLQASTTLQAGTAPPDGPPLDSIEQRVLPCAACHGAEGRATNDGYYPRIAGKPAGYLYNQLLNFRDGRRVYAQMSYMTQRQDQAYLREMAEHFAGLTLPYPAPKPATADAAALQRGATLATTGDAAAQLPSCQACHGERLTGVAPQVPGLLGLPYDYLVAQIGAWRTGNRHAQEPDCMAEIARRLKPEDIAAVAAWLAAQPLPADTHPATAFPQKPPMDCGVVEAAGAAR
ncbi:MAG TPA: c-type cytochrome [Solimonas sp.]|nr:c-type cytochrome [Solimonas sp.]